MSKFMVRVELHGAGPADYDRLHEAMERSGFSRLIRLLGALWHLPTAEYQTEENADLKEVHDRAKVAADSIGLANAILAIEYTNAGWSGLRQVQ